jgi:hypothetical protein
MCFWLIKQASANGGTFVGINLSELQCEQACAANATCVAADYNLQTTVCYAHNTLVGRMFSTCCDRYERCNAVTPSQCVDSFAVYTMTVGNGQGQWLSSATSLQACEQQCLSDSNCVAVQWTRNGYVQGGLNCMIYDGSVGSVSQSATYDLYPRLMCNAVVVPLPTPTLSPPPAGTCIRDVIFIMDNSGSILEPGYSQVQNWQIEKTFVENIITSTLTVGYYWDRVAAISFTTTATLQFNLIQDLTIASAVAAVDAIPYGGGLTNTPAALQLAITMIQSSSQGSRPGVPKVVVLITDGYNNVNNDTLPSSIQTIVSLTQLRIAVGVTNLVNNAELQAFASGPSFVYLAQNYQQLPNAQSMVTNAIKNACNSSP